MSRSRFEPVRLVPAGKPCNICGLPAHLTYLEEDAETGQLREKTHLVPCLGHEHIHYSLWNGTDDPQHRRDETQTFTAYRKFDRRRKEKQSGKR